MKRRDFITLLGGAALWAPALRAQQPQRVYQVGFITLHSAEIAQANLKSLRDNLRKLGLVETQNLQIDYWYAAGREDRLAAMAEEIVRRNLDLVVAHAAGPGTRHPTSRGQNACSFRGGAGSGRGGCRRELSQSGR